MKTLVLTFDRLAIRFLGCYGNDWVETPHFDLAAAQSVMFENHYIENVNTETANHPWSSGQSSLPPRSPFELLNSAAVSLHAVVEDEANSPRFPLRNFEHLVEASSSPELFDRTISEIEKLETKDSWLLWVKSKGIAFPSFPTGESLQLYLEDYEIELAQEITARFANWSDEKSSTENSIVGKNKQVSFPDLFDTDEERMLHAVYAACVSELDLELGMLWRRIENLRQEDLLVVISAARGEWLGEPLPEEHSDCKICKSVVHTPLLISHREVCQSVRSQNLVQTVDLLPTIFDWLGVSRPIEFTGQSLLELSQGKSEPRSHYFCGDDGRCLSVGSRDFFLRTHAGSEQQIEPESCQLYHQPEDLWLVNDIGNQWPQQQKDLLLILNDSLER